MGALERFSKLVLKVQEAALAPERWNSAVSAIVQEVDAAEGILFSQALPPSLGGFWASRSIQPFHMENYAKYYHDKDIWMLALSEKQTRSPGFVFVGESLVSPAAVRGSEFYADFLTKMDIGRLLCSIVTPHGDATVPGIHLSIFRPMNKSVFGERQRSFLNRLMPHLQAALKTHYALGASERSFAVGEPALNALPTPTMIVNPGAKVLFGNEAARRILSAADGLTTHKQLLVGSNAGETAALSAFIGGLFGPPNGRSPAWTHRIGRPSGRRPYACSGQVLPTDPTMNGLNGQPAAILFVRDPESAFSIEPEVLQKLHGFTPAEAVLAASLARGLTVEKAAVERGVSYETARAQLKSIFLKTGCRRQVELVKLLIEEFRA